VFGAARTGLLYEKKNTVADYYESACMRLKHDVCVCKTIGNEDVYCVDRL
jgi:hypothetical protein